MASYIVYWAKERVGLYRKNGDIGPLSVIYGGPHQSQPPLGKVGVGDVVYPVTVQSGSLYVLGRMTVAEIVDAEAFTARLGVVRSGHLWDSFCRDNPQLVTHRVPWSCADHAAVGADGSAIMPRLLPAAHLPLIRLGPKAGNETSLKLRGGKVATANLIGYFRRLSEESAVLFEALFV